MKLTEQIIQQVIKDVNNFKPSMNSSVKSLNIVPGFKIKYPVLEVIEYDGYVTEYTYIVLVTNATKLRVVTDIEVDAIEEVYETEDYEITVKQFLNHFHKILKEEKAE